LSGVSGAANASTLSLDQLSTVMNVFFACLSLVSSLLAIPSFPAFLHHITSEDDNDVLSGQTLGVWCLLIQIVTHFV
jgi:hypothetical protein